MRLDKGFVRALSNVEGLVVRENVPLSPYTTFRIGGPARLWIAPQGIESLVRLLQLLNGEGIRFHMLGGGSNVLVSDNGIECVVSTRGLDWIRPLTQTMLEVGAGVSMRRLLAHAIRNGLVGLEHMCGIPGSLGGAVVMNAGGSSGTIVDALDSVLVVCNGDAEWIPASRIGFGYRSATFPVDGDRRVVVAAARLQLKRSRGESLRRKIRNMMKQRRLSQPVGARSAGCIFKNPDRGHAGALIEASGLKGTRIGGAMISKRHANFIVNCKRARALDVMELIKRTREVVYQDHGVLLEPEVKTMGEEDSACLPNPCPC